MMAPMVMQRRTFLKSAGSVVAAAAIGPVALAKKKLSVGVVGGGIVGASVAMHLAQAGAKVTLFEKSAPAAGATSKSFAWINDVVRMRRQMDARGLGSGMQSFI